MAVVTPNMSLLLPTVSETTGPEYASILNEALGSEGTGVDGHDHTSGKGVPITPAALNINADVDFQTNSALNLLSSQYVSQDNAIDGTNLIYVLSGDFYMLDGNGTSIRITENGAISAASFGAITGLTSPASASFATDTFTWLYDTDKYALMASGPLLLRRDGETAPHRIKVTPPASLAADYDLTLPGSLPASNAYLYSDNAGTLAFSTTALSNSVDTASIQPLAVTTAKINDAAVSTVKIAGSAVTTAKILDANVTTAKIADAAITAAKMGALNYDDASISSGTNTSVGSYADISGSRLTLTITTLRPIVFDLQSAEAGGVPYFYRIDFGAGVGSGDIQLYLETGPVSATGLTVLTISSVQYVSVNTLRYTFTPTLTGTYTFILRQKRGSVDPSTGIGWPSMVFLGYQL